MERAAAEPCRYCGGPLHRGDYPRKPRGGLSPSAAEAFGRRFSLCCGREGCRRRATPPSVRFLGRRVYVGAVVIVASAIVALATDDRERGRAGDGGAGADDAPLAALVARPVHGEHAVRGAVGAAGARARAPPAAHLAARAARRRSGRPAVTRLLGWLAPLTTASYPDGSRLAEGPRCSRVAPAAFAQKMALTRVFPRRRRVPSTPRQSTAAAQEAHGPRRRHAQRARAMGTSALSDPRPAARRARRRRRAQGAHRGARRAPVAAPAPPARRSASRSRPSSAGGTPRAAPTDPIAALARKVPRHAGTHPSSRPALAEAIARQHRDHPRWTFQLHYDNLARARARGPAPRARARLRDACAGS